MKKHIFSLSEAENQDLDQLLAPLTGDANVLRMKDFIQHGRVTTYEHCMGVTRCSYFLAKRLHLKVEPKALVRGAMLHDFYLYDWHGRSAADWTHSYLHPRKARANAIKYFQVGEKEQNIIGSHMWPLTFMHMPKCKEAWIVTIADKSVSLGETLFKRG